MKPAKRTTLSIRASHYALEKIALADRELVGTPDYMGLAYFWAYAYRHYLRDASPAKRRKTHYALLSAGLDLAGESDRHLSIIRSVLKLT